MATTGTRPAVPTQAGLQELAKRHLWMHFTRHGAFAEADVPIIVRGEGPYVWDEHGNRYLDGLSALFCVNVGHGRTELGEAAARQVEELDFFIDLELRAPARDRAGDADRLARAGRPEPRLLHLRRLRGGGVGDQAGARLSPADRQPSQDEVHHPRDRLPRHDPGGARRDRHLGPSPRVRAAGAGWPPGAEHQQLSLAGGPGPAVGGRPDRGDGSSTSTPTRSPR